MKQSYYSCGKLLITGEYLVLRGARGLALPTSRGQRLDVESASKGELIWRSLNEQGQEWFRCDIELATMQVKHSSDNDIAERLVILLKAARNLSSNFLSSKEGFSALTELEFPRDWGLGSSSTLVNCIAQWAQVDPFRLFISSQTGSGYDVKVAELHGPIIFWRNEDEGEARQVNFNPPFKESIWFVHLGAKQDSQKEVVRFSDISVSEQDIDQVTRITREVIIEKELLGFERLLREHDLILSRILSVPTAFERFSGYEGGYCKYLGAWGGDFMLVTGQSKDLDFFRNTGYDTILSYDEMLLK
ncbi:MAG: GHMP kinase [Flavobacteriales bacterium]|nr:GHMP kinase [Flavobacteriales bacterium]NNK80023.1 GHMP kinase [Flavobacteriales bacterium]